MSRAVSGYLVCFGEYCVGYNLGLLVAIVTEK